MRPPSRALTPGPSPISLPRPRRERGGIWDKAPFSDVVLPKFSPLPGAGGREMGEGPGVRALFGGLEKMP
jgi:hypothetical protein